MPSNAEIVREAMNVVWTQGNAERVADYYAEDFVADYPMTDWGTGLDGVRALVENVRVGLPDFNESIETLVDSGDYIAVELLIRGTHIGSLNGMAPTGEQVAFRDVTILKLRDGKIIEQRGLSDYLSLFAQLGVDMPTGTQG